MSQFAQISPDDPRLTAYALGELEPAERAEFEQLLEHDAAARALVAAISGTTHRIGVVLADEPVPPFGAGTLAQAAIIPGRNRRLHDGGPLPADSVPNLRRGLATMLRFPQLYFTISGLAAACFAVGFLIWEMGYVPPKKVHYTEIDLTKFAPVDAAKGKIAAESESELEIGLNPETAGYAAAADSRDAGGNDNAFVATERAPVSSFPIKVGTAAYSNVRHLIESGRRPSREAVRIEELVNYFPYHYAPPDREVGSSARRDGGTLSHERETQPFAAHLEVASAPWAPEHRLVRIGLKGREAQQLSMVSGREIAPAIAKKVTILVKFNPAQVQSYRLIGYENRHLSPEKNSDEMIDAGEIVAGHTVTALYEILPVGGAAPAGAGAANAGEFPSVGTSQEGAMGELLTLKVNYQEPGREVSRRIEFPLRDAGHTFDRASADFKFAASIAAFGMILRDSPYKGAATFAQVKEWLQAGPGNETGGARREFMGLVSQAEHLLPH